MRTSTRKTCDLVMKGGVTSGLVFPGSVAELSKNFTFCNIGGTSAGAIAAVVTAAAEYRRFQNPTAACNADGIHPAFSDVLGVAQELGAPSKVRDATRMVDLFQAPPHLQPALALALAATKKGANSKLAAALAVHRKHWPAMKEANVGLLLGVGLATLSVFGFTQNATLFGGVTALATLFAGAGVYALGYLKTLKRVLGSLGQRDHLFGLCSGKSDQHPLNGDDTENPGLTIWMHQKIQQMAGRGFADDPLTLRDLQSVSDGQLTLKTMTTALNLGRPYLLPFSDPEDVGDSDTQTGFFFDRAEWERLLPKPVLNFMCEGQRPVTLDNGQELYPFPGDERLPLLVAARMSLSFPLLLAATPLWRKVRVNLNLRRPNWERVWFSDGGLCSNFPIHLFDRMLPRRPTFAIDLEYVDPTRFEGSKPERDLRVWMPQSHNVSEHLPRWYTTYSRRAQSDTLGGFALSIWNTMQNWNDTTLAAVPGYYERIARVRLKMGEEGGFSFDMTAQDIENLASYGTEAAQQLNQRYGDNPDCEPESQATPCQLDWDDHRWTRLRTSFAATQRMLHTMNVAFTDRAANYPKLVAQNSAPDYQGPHAWQDPSTQSRKLGATLKDLEQVLKELDEQGAGGLNDDNQPKPRPEMKFQPEL